MRCSLREQHPRSQLPATREGEGSPRRPAYTLPAVEARGPCATPRPPQDHMQGGAACCRQASACFATPRLKCSPLPLLLDRQPHHMGLFLRVRTGSHCVRLAGPAGIQGGGVGTAPSSAPDRAALAHDGGVTRTSASTCSPAVAPPPPHDPSLLMPLLPTRMTLVCRARTRVRDGPWGGGLTGGVRAKLRPACRTAGQHSEHARG